jgi:acyl-CoA thioesterase-1
MRYVALGDSISIDDYTGVPEGGAASQLARKLRVTEFQNLTRDGNVVPAVLVDLDRITEDADLVTLTVGGNDLLLGERVETILAGIGQIVARVRPRTRQLILNTIYDPTDGDDRAAEAMGLPQELRQAHRQLNDGIARLVGEHGAALCDLERLLHGHGAHAPDTWLTRVIEPNLAGATAIAEAWYALAREGEAPPHP